MQGSSITSISEVPSPSEVKPAISDFWNMEKLFVCGVLDELRICFSCSYQVSPETCQLWPDFVALDLRPCLFHYPEQSKFQADAGL